MMLLLLFWVKRPFETVFQSISGRLPERGRKRRERIEESKNVQTTPTRTYCKRNRPLSYYHQNCRMPRDWKFTQDNGTTRPPQWKKLLEDWLKFPKRAWIFIYCRYDISVAETQEDTWCQKTLSCHHKNLNIGTFFINSCNYPKIWIKVDSKMCQKFASRAGNSADMNQTAS